MIDTPIACTAPGKGATMDDFEFDFEDDIAATDEGQPQEAPESMPDRARKNYRQVRARGIRRARDASRSTPPSLTF